MILVCMCVRMYVSFMSIGCMYHEYDRRTGDVDIKRRRRRFFSVTDLDSQWPNSWRSEVWAGIRVCRRFTSELPPCVWG